MPNANDSQTDQAAHIDAAVSEAAHAIVTARDACGDERRAAQEAFADEGVDMTSELLGRAQREANAEWRESQKEAGVDAKHWRY